MMSNSESSYRFSEKPQESYSAAGGSNPVNSDSSSYLDDQYPDSLGADVLSIALIGPDEDRRRAAASALAGCQGGEIREFSSYPPSLDDVPRLLEAHYDVIIIDLDSHPEYALELVESICANGSATVMVYSVKADSELLVRCMRAGAREFLTMPFAQSTMAEALVRASARRPATRPAKKTGGRLLVFLGAKGGDGVTTLACNFAVSMAQESSQSTLLIDLDLPLGDAALNLGVAAEYSTINALQNAARLDSAFLSKLLVKHSTGVSVLAAPGKFPGFDATNEAIDRLLMVARQDFDNVVIDMGSRLDLMGTGLFKDGSTVYLVIQAGIAGLRNSNRLISQYFNTGIPKLEIVLNRFEPRTMGVSEDQITKALTRPAQWKIPNDYAAVRRMQTTAVPLAMEDSPISRLIRQMARTACGLPAAQEKEKKSGGFSLKGFSRSISSRVSVPDESAALTSLGLTSDREDDDSSSGNSQRESQGKSVGRSSSAASAKSSPAARTQSPAESTDRVTAPSAKRASSSQLIGPETRTYKGSTYVKGADGEWHLQEPETAAVVQEAPVARPEPPVVRHEAPVARPEPQVIRREPPVVRQEPPVVAQEPPAVVEQPQQPVVQETPAMAWSTPNPIGYGTPLSNTQLRAMAAVPGKFVYTPAVGEVLSVGTHTLLVSFTPNDLAAYTKAECTVSLIVNKATPSVTWAKPAAITYGTALSAAQLNAAASIPGKFTYTPSLGEVLSAGVQTLSVEFIPADSDGYNTAQATVSLTVTKESPAISWSAPKSILHGTPLSTTQLNALASVPGSFTYSPAAGAVLPAGVQTLSVTFNPTDAADFTPAQTTVQLTVTKGTPAIRWSKPAPITYGTPLGANQLNATSTVPGKFAYIPGAGAVLAAGTHTPSVIFTPEDATNYNPVQAAVSLTVTKATPEIVWPSPTPITYGSALGTAQLNATASVPGKFVYTPAAGEVLAAGEHTLSVSFTPTDATDYSAVQASVPLTVAKAKPTTITWPTPAAISHGTRLSAAQLNATASIPGRFVYTPAAGEVLGAGTHTLSVTFTPTDTNFPAAQATVPLSVTKAIPTITWPAPVAISYGTALGAAQLKAAASVSGSFVYAPPAGEVLAAGTHTLTATFTPANTADEATAQATVSLTVNKATPIITWPTPAAISYGTPLGAAQLNATALVPGTFMYTPAAGTVLAAGTPVLSVTFVPADATDYTTAQATVSLVVEGLANFESLMPAGAEADAVLRSDQAEIKPGTPQGGSAPTQQGKLETRVYKGATYVKGADGQWYLQKE
jgi:Flp pilus assembly CpaE family ATPase